MSLKALFSLLLKPDLILKWILKFLICPQVTYIYILSYIIKIWNLTDTHTIAMCDYIEIEGKAM